MQKVRYQSFRKFQIQYYNINQILYMEKSFAFAIAIAMIITLTKCDIQTGVIDVNRQMGNLDQINGYENSLAYTHLFTRAFSTLPKIATSITEFATDSQQGFQIKIKTRKIQTDATKFKIIIIARTIISVWQRLVINYFVTDRTDFDVNTISLETSDLAGLSSVPEQLFQINFNRQFVKPVVGVFLNGFDVQTRGSYEGQLVFQASIQVTQILTNKFTVSVTRVSRTEIYLISIGYIAADQINREDYSLQVIKSSHTIPQIAPQCPYLFTQQHQLNLEHTKLMYGFEQFRFKYEGKQKSIKNLAILIEDKQITVGSYDSKNLQAVSFSYMVIKQSVKCKSDQIRVRDPSTRALSCKKCQTNNNKVPNKSGDACICLQNHFQIKQKCYKVPDNGKWQEEDKKFICNDLYTLIIKSEAYICEKTPKNKIYDSKIEQWVCIPSYYLDSFGECIKIPPYGFINPSTNLLQCQNPYRLISGECLKAEENEVYSQSENKFICVKDSYRIKGFCLKPHPNSQYSEQLKDIICDNDYYPKTERSCEKIPDLMIYDQKQKKLICQQDLFDIKDEGCKKKPQFMVYDPILKKFVCEPEKYLFRGECRKAEQNQEWNQKIKQFVCKSGAHRIKQQCRFPRRNTRYSQILQDFVCIQEHYLILNQCQPVPPKMRYNQLFKKFVCQKQYHQLQNNQKIQCLDIPQNTKWDDSIKKFICIQNYFQLKDGSCRKPEQNQKYDQKTKQFFCKDNFVKIGKSCKPLPKYSIYDTLTNDFKCIQSHFKYQKQQCLPCREDCFECHDANNCKQCRKGFELTSPSQGKQIRCVEKCGDGIRYNHQCDDGNQISGDGCSLNCQVQKGWRCNGGSPQSADKCQMTFSPAIPQNPKKILILFNAMSHLYGKIVLNLIVDGIQNSFLNNRPDITTIFFQIMTSIKNRKFVYSILYLPDDAKFVVVLDFKTEPIESFNLKININPQIKQKYYPNHLVKNLYVMVNPAYMALRDNPESL